MKHLPEAQPQPLASVHALSFGRPGSSIHWPSVVPPVPVTEVAAVAETMSQAAVVVVLVVSVPVVVVVVLVVGSGPAVLPNVGSPSVAVPVLPRSVVAGDIVVVGVGVPVVDTPSLVVPMVPDSEALSEAEDLGAQARSSDPRSVTRRQRCGFIAARIDHNGSRLRAKTRRSTTAGDQVIAEV
ncbi:MAG: hypothetical protein H0T76_26260 [Nannocystis sp.]|nr:hypothetical protein [Nannocystis sp.]